MPLKAFKLSTSTRFTPRRHRPDRVGGYRAKAVKPPAAFDTDCNTRRGDAALDDRIEALAAMYAAAAACGSEFLARRAGLPASVSDLPWGLELS